MSLNKVILVGNAGKDPVVRYFDKGVAKATFPLATSESYINQQGETITSTEWHNIVVWRGLAKVAENYIRKGTQLYLEGRIRTRNWTDQNGATRYTTEIYAENIELLGKRPEGGVAPLTPSNNQQQSQSQGPAPTAPPAAPANNDETNDLPF